MYYPLLRATAGQTVPFFVYDGTTRAPVTGEAANITVYLSKDTAAGLVATNPVAEKGAAFPGVYTFVLTEAETSAAVYLTISPICSTPGVEIDPIFAALRSDTLSGSEMNQLRQALGLGDFNEWEAPDAAGTLGITYALFGGNSVRDDYVYDTETGKVLKTFNLYVYDTAPHATAHAPVGQGIGPQAGCRAIVALEATHSSVNIIGFKGVRSS